LPRWCSSSFLFSRSKQTPAAAVAVVGAAEAVTPEESADTAVTPEDTAGTGVGSACPDAAAERALLHAAAVVGVPSVRRISARRESAGRESAARGSQLARLEAAVSPDVH
jgi:hypothetical protein